MELLEITIILLILCAQGYVAYLAWGQIESISHFLSSEDNLELKQTTVNLKEETTTNLECETTTNRKEEGESNKVYQELESPLSLGTYYGEDVSAGELFSFYSDYELKVGDKLSLGASKIDATVLEIQKQDKSFSSYIVNLRLDWPVKRGTSLYKIGGLVDQNQEEAPATVGKVYPKEDKERELATATVSEICLKEDEKSALLRNVIKTINNYLKKNKGGAADFHLIKDIVERHTDSIDEEINHKLPVPIYLGLMGTVLGIIVGLFSLKFQFDSTTSSLNGELFVNSVSGLINGVKLAMICSFVGLTLTTLLSSWRYMGAKSKLEAQKNAFYDFIQTRLLPQMTKDAASTILALQANLEKFNTSFEENIDDFGSIMDDIHNALDSQVALQKELKRMDLTQVANLNSNVLVQLRRSMTEFEKFTQYLNQMNTFVRSTAKLTDSINDQLQRTEAVETIVHAMQENIERNQRVMSKLRDFLERVNEQQAVVTATGMIDSTMAQAIEQLQTHTQEQINSIRTYTTEATEDLHDLVTSERQHLRSLDKLGKLDDLVSAINSMRDDNKSINAALETKIESLAHAVVNNTKIQHGDNGMPSWLRIGCLFLLVITCVVVILACVRYISDNKQGGVEQTEMYNNAIGVDSTATDTIAIDTIQ